MTKTAMPEPVGLTTPENLHSVHGGEAALMFWSVSMRAEGEVALYTTAQMEAYAATKVREALEAVEPMLTNMYTDAVKARVPEDQDEEGWNSHCLERALALTDAMLQIRALIPK